MVPTHIKTPAQLGPLIKARRLELGMDQITLAKNAKISRTWLLAIEKGTSGASIGLILRVLSALRMSMVLQADQNPSGTYLQDKTPIRSVNLDRLVDRLKRRSQ